MRIRSVFAAVTARSGLVIGLCLALFGSCFAQESGPGSADREWRFIEQLEKDGMADLVLRQLEQFAANFRDDPRAARALLRAAHGHRAAGGLVTASALYERLLRDFPSSEEAPAAGLARADLFTEAEQWDRALAAYQSVLEAYPASTQAESAVLGLAEAHMARNEDVQARRLLGRLVGGRASDEVGSRALFDLALLDLRAGADSLAIERFDAIHQRYEGRPIGAFGLLRSASLLVEREAPAAARERYELVLDRFDEPILRARAHLGLAALVERDDPARAARHYRSVAEEGGTAADVEAALLGLARASLAAGDAKAAREAASAYLARDPDGAGASHAHLVLARADLAQKKEGALDALLALGDAADADVAHQALITAAGLQEGSGDPDAALATWRRAELVASTGERRAAAVLEQARIRAGTNRSALAADLALAAHDHAAEPATRARALYVAMEGQSAAGLPDEALATARRILAEHPLSEYAGRARTRVHELERAAQIDPVEAARALAALAQRQIDDPAARSIGVARILRDRLGEIDTAIAVLRDAIAQSSDAGQRAGAEVELARTHLLQARRWGAADDHQGAIESIERARAVLGDAIARAEEHEVGQRAELLRMGIDLAAWARPEAPWTFDPETTPLAATLAEGEATLGPDRTGLRERSAVALQRITATNERAWVVWRWAEIAPAPLPERIEQVRAALEDRLDPRAESSLRLVLGQLLLAAEEAAPAASERARVVEREGSTEIGLAARFALAEAHRAQQRYAQAGELYAEYAAAVPWTRRGQRALLLSGDCELYTGRDDEAIARYRGLVERYPGSTYEDDALFRLGTALDRSGRLEAAREPLVRLARADTGSEYRGRALASLASIERRAGRLEQASAALEELTSVDPERAAQESAWNQLARLSLDRDDPARALQWLDRGAERVQPDAEAFALRVEAASRRGDLRAAESALQSFSRAFTDAGDRIADARLHFAQAQRAAGRRDDALASVEIALTETTDATVRARAHYEMGMNHAQSRRWDDARSSWEAAERAAPESSWAAEALMRRGQLHDSLNEFDQAQRAFGAVVARFPGSPHVVDAMLGEARALRSMGRYDLALERYHLLLEQHPDAPGAEDVLSNIAYCHHEMGQYEIAIAAYRRVMPYLDEEGQAYAVFWIADGLNELGRHQEAAAEFLRISYQYPDQGMLPVTAQLRAAEAYERVQDPEATRALYERVRRTHGPGSDGGREAQQRLDRLPPPREQKDARGQR